MFIRGAIIFFVLLAFSSMTYAQEQDESGNNPSAGDLQETAERPDSLTTPSALDTLDAKISKADSAQQALEAKLEQLEAPGAEISALDSAKAAIQAKKDSLEALNLPHEKYLHKLDSLGDLPENKLNEQVQKAERKVKEKVDNLKEKAEKKIAGEEQLDQMTDHLPEDQLPDLKEELPEADLPETDISTDEIIPEDVKADLDLDVKDELNIEKPEEISEFTDKADEIKAVPQEKIAQGKEAANLDEVSEKIGQAGEVTDQVSGYSEDLSKARQGNMEGVEQRLEEQAVQVDEVGEFKQQSAEFDKLKQQHEEYGSQLEEYQKEATQYADPEFVKQRILEKSKHVVQAEVLDQYKAKIAAARQELSVIKKPDVKADTLKKALKRQRVNPLHDKPLRERLKPGFQLEINRSVYTSFDLAAAMAYRLNDKMKIHGQYLYRFNYSSDDHEFTFATHTYGPRLHASYEFYRGFYAAGGGDRIRTDVPRGPHTAETVRKWVNSAWVGIGRAYAFAGTVKGHVQVSYNFLHNTDSPYPRKFNIRFGFDFDLTKRKKKKFRVPTDKKYRKLTREKEGR